MIKRARDFIRLIRYWQEHPLASRDMGGTLLRFFRWQIGSSLLGAPVVWPWINSTFLVMERGMTGATMNIYCGLQDFRDMAFVLQFLRAGDQFVDLGANVGTYTILASGVVGARTLSVEPIPETFGKLRRNLAVNRLEDLVQAECCGAGEKEGTFLFVADQDTTNQVAPPHYAGRTVEVPMKSMDALANDFPAIMWKVDVEGLEEQVLAGGAQVLQSKMLNVVMMEGESAAIRAAMISHGFQLYTYVPFLRQLTDGDSNPTIHNWLWIRDKEEVMRRLATAPKYLVNGVTF